jgi:hypothetical protein
MHYYHFYMYLVDVHGYVRGWMRTHCCVGERICVWLLLYYIYRE